MRIKIFRFFGGVILAVSPLVASAAPFTAGDLVVYRTGTGSAALTSAATAVFVDEYTPSGTLVQSIPMPTSVSGSQLRLTASGTATSEGYLNLSTNDQYITLTGYNAAVGASGVASSSTTGGSAVVRVVGRIDASGNVDTSTSTTSYSGNNIRSTISTNGTNIWLSGPTSGVSSTTFGASGAAVQVSTTTNNTRDLEIYGSTPQLYASSNNGSFTGVNTVGSGLPTSTGNTIANIINSASVYGFFLAHLNPSDSGVDTAYVADDGVGIEKYSLVGSSWVANGVIGTAADAYRGLTGSVTSGGGVQLYATRQGSNPGIVGVLDTTGYNHTIGGTASLIVPLPTNEAFRGIDYAPSNVPEPSAVILAALGALVVAIGRRRLGRNG
jgi:PEP-CTERM motif